MSILAGGVFVSFGPQTNDLAIPQRVPVNGEGQLIAPAVWWAHEDEEVAVAIDAINPIRWKSH